MIRFRTRKSPEVHENLEVVFESELVTDDLWNTALKIGLGLFDNFRMKFMYLQNFEALLLYKT